jgi:hypothetical protein
MQTPQDPHRGIPWVSHAIHDSARRNRGKYWDGGELLVRDAGERYLRSSHGPVGEPRGLEKLESRRERLFNGTTIPITRVGILTARSQISRCLSFHGLRWLSLRLASRHKCDWSCMEDSDPRSRPNVHNECKQQ